MQPGSPDGPALPNDVLIVEDDPIIALDFEDRILGFGVMTVRTASNVAGALDMIELYRGRNDNPVAADDRRRLLVREDFAREHWTTTGFPEGTASTTAAATRPGTPSRRPTSTSSSSSPWTPSTRSATPVDG